MKLSSILILALVTACMHEVRAQTAEPSKNPEVMTFPKLATPFEGGSPNRIAQLGACKELVVPSFSELNQINNAAFTLLTNTHGKEAERAYQKAAVYDNAVLLNTAAAVADAKIDVSKAVILKPYYSSKSSENTGFRRLPFGYYLKGFTGIPVPPAGLRSRSDRYGTRGAIEVQTDENGDTHFDIDLYNPNSNYYREHLEELLFNEAYKRPTHPGDVAKLLFEDRKLKTGVSCKNQMPKTTTPPRS